MSRVIGFGLDGKSVGELHADCDRGWAINEGGQTTITIPADEAAHVWLDFGRMVLVEHPRLPAWAGVIDTDWNAKIPAQITVYDCGYLLALRSLEAATTKLTGTTGKLVDQLVGIANGYEDLNIRPGNVDYYTGGERTVEFDQRTIYEHIISLVKKAGMEIMFYPKRDVDKKLFIYYDLVKALGVETSVELHDGKNANMVVHDVNVVNPIYNRMSGVGDQSTAGSRITSGVQSNLASQQRYRLRNKVYQVNGIASVSALYTAVQTALAYAAYPKLRLSVDVLDVREIQRSLRLGNTLWVHAADILLPGGVRGWRGQMRITAMGYEEAKNGVSLEMEGYL